MLNFLFVHLYNGEKEKFATKTPPKYAKWLYFISSTYEIHTAIIILVRFFIFSTKVLLSLIYIINVIVHAATLPLFISARSCDYPTSAAIVNTCFIVAAAIATIAIFLITLCLRVRDRFGMLLHAHQLL